MQSATWGAFPRLMIGSHLACYDLAKADHDLGLILASITPVCIAGPTCDVIVRRAPQAVTQ